MPVAVTLGEPCMCVRAHTHKRVSSPCTHFIGRERWRLEGEAEGDRRGGVGWGQEEGTETRAPRLPSPSRGSILKAALSLCGRMGWGRGAVVLLVNTGSATLPSYPWQPERDGGPESGQRESQGDGERRRTWKGSAAVRECSVGAECEEQSSQWFSFFPLFVCFILSTDGSLFSLVEIKKLWKRGTNTHTLVCLIEFCLYSKSNGLFSLWHKVPSNVKKCLCWNVENNHWKG